MDTDKWIHVRTLSSHVPLPKLGHLVLNYAKNVVVAHLGEWAEDKLFRAVPQARFVDRTEVPVHAMEEVLRLASACEAVRCGSLRATDLVDVGRGWESVSDCVELGEALDQHRSRAKRRRVAVIALAASTLPIAVWGLRAAL